MTAPVARWLTPYDHADHSQALRPGCQKRALIASPFLGRDRTIGVGVRTPSSVLSLLLSLCLNSVSVDPAKLVKSSSLMAWGDQHRSPVSVIAPPLGAVNAAQ